MEANIRGALGVKLTFFALFLVLFCAIERFIKSLHSREEELKDYKYNKKECKCSYQNFTRHLFRD
jgi:hypothetical protein